MIPYSYKLAVEKVVIFLSENADVLRFVRPPQLLPAIEYIFI
jgi:hypothetical protein